MSILKHPRTPTTPGMVDYQNADHEQLMKRLRPAPSMEEVILMIFVFNFIVIWVFLKPVVFLLQSCIGVLILYFLVIFVTMIHVYSFRFPILPLDKPLGLWMIYQEQWQ